MENVLEEFQQGRTIYVPGATGESLALAETLQVNPDRLQDVHIVSCLLPGFNETDYAGLNEKATLSCFLLPSESRSSFEAGRVRLLPLAYTEIARYLGNHLEFDVAIAHVSPPDKSGFCSLGIAADFTPLVWNRAKIRILIVNNAMPRIKRGPALSLVDSDVVAEINSPLITSEVTETRDTNEKIAATVASIVDDDSTVQIGLGTVPDAVWRHLKNHRNVTVASGVITKEVQTLFELGVLQKKANHLTGFAIGDKEFYKFLADSDLFEFATVPKTHGLVEIASRKKFTAINSALEVDLFGQVNLEWRKGHVVSGVGGAPDFVQGAANSAGGRSIIALPSTIGKGKGSRIVARLKAATVSLTRSEVDTVVTEHGIAELKNKSLEERARALVEIAAPEVRSELAGEWEDSRTNM